jgi:hypothetical protein
MLFNLNLFLHPKSKENSGKLMCLDFRTSNLIFLDFFIVFGNCLKKIFKGKVYPLSLYLKKYFFLQSQKMKSIIEINKLLKIMGNLSNLKFQNTVFNKKPKNKKKLLTIKSFHKKLKGFFVEKGKVFFLKNDPIKIQFFTQKNTFMGKNKFTTDFQKKGYFPKMDNLQKKKISFRAYYSFSLSEYIQSKVFFDSTGRRINSFTSILDQVFYILKRIHSFPLPIKPNFLDFYYEVISFLSNLQTGGCDIFRLCYLKKKENVFRRRLDNLLFLKWKILEEIDLWKKKFSFKSKILLSFGHTIFSSDHSFEKVFKQIKISKNCNIYKSSDEQNNIKMLKHPFENLNFYFNHFRKHLFKIKNIEINNISYWNIRRRKCDTKLFFNLTSIYITNKYKEIFFENNFKLYEKKIFAFVWIFLENFNFTISLLELYSMIFRKNIDLSLEKLRTFIKISIKSTISKTNYFQRKKLKVLLKQKNIKFLNFFIQDHLPLKIGKIFKKSTFFRKYTNLTISVLKIFSDNRLVWFEYVQLLDKIDLIKEYLTEKSKIFLKNFKKEEPFIEKNLNLFKKTKVCTIQSFVQKKEKETNILLLTIIDLVENAKNKQIKINFNKEIIIPLFLFIIMKYRIFSFFFILKNKLSDNFLIYIKNQFTKILNSEFLEYNGGNFLDKFKNIFNLINCMIIWDYDENCIFKTPFEYLTYKKKSLLFTFIQTILKGPVALSGSFRKKTSIFKKLTGINFEFFFIHQFQDIFFFISKQFNLKQFCSESLWPKTFFLEQDRIFCKLGLHNVFYIKKRGSLIENQIRKNFEDKFIGSSKLEFSSFFDFSRINFEKIRIILTNLRSLDLNLYLIFKKVFYNEMTINWNYQSIYNFTKVKQKIDNKNNFEKENFFKSFETHKTIQFYLEKALKFLIINPSCKMVPRSNYRNIKDGKIIFLKKNPSLGLMTSWNKKLLKLNLLGSLNFLENNKKSRSNIISGLLDTGSHFFIEKLCILNNQLRFKFLILKKLNTIPAKVISVYPKISQIKFSSLTDEKRFLYFRKKFLDNFNNFITPLEPFKFFKDKLNGSYCKNNHIEQFIKNQKIEDFFIYITSENEFRLSFVTDKKLGNFFYFKIQVFFDKKNFLFIYKWKRKIFLGPENLFENFIRPFKKDFFKIIKHPDFIGCGFEKLEIFLQKTGFRKGEKLFLFTFKENEFLVFEFISINKLGSKIKGSFSYSPGKFLWDDSEFLSINNLKEASFNKNK